MFVGEGSFRPIADIHEFAFIGHAIVIVVSDHAELLQPLHSLNASFNSTTLTRLPLKFNGQSYAPSFSFIYTKRYWPVPYPARPNIVSLVEVSQWAQRLRVGGVLKNCKPLILFMNIFARNKALHSMLVNGNFSFGSGHHRMETTCQTLIIFIKLNTRR